MKKTVALGNLLVLLSYVAYLIPTASATSTPDAPEPVSLDGIINADSDDTLAFTPDGNTVFFDRSEGKHKTILISRKVSGHWSKPEVASFSGTWFDQDPVVSPDGSYLLFDSDRPVKPGSKPLIQDYFVGGLAPGSNIWRVGHKGGGWGSLYG
jgi:Tol biopolymer transport system component